MSLQVNTERFRTLWKQSHSLQVVISFFSMKKGLGLLLASWVGVLILVAMEDISSQPQVKDFWENTIGKPVQTVKDTEDIHSRIRRFLHKNLHNIVRIVLVTHRVR